MTEYSIAGRAPLSMLLVGGNQRAKPEGTEPLTTVTNYDFGAHQRWHDVKNYTRVAYAGVYAGIDMAYSSAPGGIEYDFTVAPGSDPRRIRMHFSGVSKLEVDSASGDLVLTSGDSEVTRHSRPRFFQSGDRAEFTGGFRMVDRHTVAFDVGRYDRKLPLIIDPTVTVVRFIEGTGTDMLSHSLSSMSSSLSRCASTDFHSA